MKDLSKLNFAFQANYFGWNEVIKRSKVDSRIDSDANSSSSRIVSRFSDEIPSWSVSETMSSDLLHADYLRLEFSQGHECLFFYRWYISRENFNETERHFRLRLRIVGKRSNRWDGIGMFGRFYMCLYRKDGYKGRRVYV